MNPNAILIAVPPLSLSADMETECYPCIPMQHVSVQNSPPLAAMAPTFTTSATSKKARIVTNGIGNGGA